MTCAVVLPVKDFRQAKARLAPAIDADRRQRLARALATSVVQAAVPLPVSVVCDDIAVAEWAAEAGASVIWTPGLGLNGAVTAGCDELRRRGIERLVVVHSDLVLARDLGWLAREPGITIVADRHGDGTNALSIPAHIDFRFSYGARSFTRHLAEAGRHGVAVTIAADPTLALDIDRPDDLALVPPGVLPADLSS